MQVLYDSRSLEVLEGRRCNSEAGTMDKGVTEGEERSTSNEIC